MNSNTKSTLLVLLILVACQQHPSSAMEMRNGEVNLFALTSRYEPSSYKLKLELHPRLDTFEGEVEIDLKMLLISHSELFILASTIGRKEVPHLASESNNIILNSEGLEVSDVKLEEGEHSLLKPRIYHDATHKILVVSPKNYLDPLEDVKLTLWFKGKVQKDGKGLFRSFIGSSHALATNFKPAYARRLFPCFDQPGFKATFELSIQHPEGTIALSNMPLRRLVTITGLVESRFEPTPEISSYMLSLTVGEFEPIESAPRLDGTKIVIYAPRGRTGCAQHMLTKAVQAYDSMRGLIVSLFVGIPRPVKKIDIVAVHMKHAALENLGLITMRWDILCQEQDKPEDRIYALTVLMNQMVRFWIANSVNLGWWTEIWFIEGLVNYLTSELITKLRPEISSELHTLIDTTYSAMDADDDPQRSRPIVGGDPKTADEIEESFNPITYKKAEAVIRMFSSLLNKDSFNYAIHSFIKRHNDDLEGGEEWLLELMNFVPFHALDREKTLLMIRGWIEQAGYPIIFASISENRKYLVLRQQSNLGNADSWSVPFSCTFYTGRHVRNSESHVLFALSVKIKFPKSFNLRNRQNWIKLNVGYQGYYRVIYESKPLRMALARAIKRGYVQPADRLQLLSDSYAHVKRSGSMEDFGELLKSLSESGETDEGVMLLLTRMANELHEDRWSLALSVQVTDLMMKYLSRRVSGEADLNLLKQYAKDQVLDCVNRLKSIWARRQTKASDDSPLGALF